MEIWCFVVCIVIVFVKSELEDPFQVELCHVSQQTVWVRLKIVQHACGNTGRGSYCRVNDHLSGHIDNLSFRWGFLYDPNRRFTYHYNRTWRLLNYLKSFVVILFMRRGTSDSVILLLKKVVILNHKQPGFILLRWLPVFGGTFDLKYFFPFLGVWRCDDNVADFLLVTYTTVLVLVMVVWWDPVSCGWLVLPVRVPVVVLASPVHFIY